MKKKITIILILIVVVCGAIYAALTLLSSQNSLRAEREEGMLGVMPLRDSLLEVEVVPGLRFKIDTGSDLSTITESDLELLDSLGFKPEKSFYPVVGRDGDGCMRAETTRYTVTLPLMSYRFETDSTGTKLAVATWNDANKIHNVDFAPSRTGQSVLGIDFLEHFIVEYQYGNRAVALYKNLPKDYQKCIDITYSRAPAHGLWLGKRYYVALEIDGDIEPFFIDTGLRTKAVKLPASYLKEKDLELPTCTIGSAIGNFVAKIHEDVLVSIGDRVGRADLSYYDSGEEPRALNPLRMFTQDALLDFGNGSLYFRPIYNIPEKSPALVARVIITE